MNLRQKAKKYKQKAKHYENMLNMTISQRNIIQTTYPIITLKSYYGRGYERNLKNWDRYKEYLLHNISDEIAKYSKIEYDEELEEYIMTTKIVDIGDRNERG